MEHNEAFKKKVQYIDYFRQTIDIVNWGGYQLDNGIVMQMPSDKSMQQRTIFYEKETSVRNIPPGPPTLVRVENKDCLDAAQLLLGEGYHPAVLNMANRHHPGGGVKYGARAQEESIFRRTNIYRSLYQFAPWASMYRLTASCHQYPMDKNFGGIYSPDVFVFRETEQKECALLDNPFYVSVISVAGVYNPQLTADGMMAPSPVELTKNKIRTIFRIGLLNGHDSLVLGAIGCGAFQNPPRHVALLFKEVMNEPEFRNKYRLLYFAILEDHNSHRAHNPEGNLKPFQTVFADMCSSKA